MIFNHLRGPRGRMATYIDRSSMRARCVSHESNQIKEPMMHIMIAARCCCKRLLLEKVVLKL